jgi:5-methylcytosine-specific restriction endonuclease McrA
MSSQAVKNWRQNTKRRMVQAMGGRCAVCHYNFCMDALEFHHKDPAQKDFTLGNIRATPKAWKHIVEELKKCVLLCSRCHKEVHAHMTVVPDNAPGFDPAWEDYKKVEAAGMTTQCFCGAPKRPEAKHCSLRCAGIHRERFAWEDYDLEAMLTIMSKSQAAEDIGVSLSALNKQLRKAKKCRVCGKTISHTNDAYCSIPCAAKSRRKVDWDEIDLAELKKTMSKSAIARHLGVSDVAVGKRLKNWLPAEVPPLAPLS